MDSMTPQRGVRNWLCILSLRKKQEKRNEGRITGGEGREDGETGPFVNLDFSC